MNDYVSKLIRTESPNVAILRHCSAAPIVATVPVAPQQGTIVTQEELDSAMGSFDDLME